VCVFWCVGGDFVVVCCREIAKRVFNKNRPASEILVSTLNFSIKRSELMCLQQKEWLNSTVIDYYLTLLQQRDRAQRLSG